jgi:F0F1-type ATP synthase assembly protein I
MKNKIDTQTLILIIILMMGLINGLTSCSKHIKNISTPSRRQINRAMKYSTGYYKMNITQHK